MSRTEYINRLTEAYEAGDIDETQYFVGIDNASIVCDDDDYRDERLPEWYAEVEYADPWTDPYAYEGMRFDDMNYLRYMER